MYLNSKKYSFYKIIRKQNDTSLNNSFSIFNENGTIEFDLSICQYPFLDFCNKELIWEPRSNNTQCKTYYNSSTIKKYFNPNSTEMDFIVSGNDGCYSSRCQYFIFSYHNYNNFNRTDDEDWKKCCYILYLFNKEYTYFRVEEFKYNNEYIFQYIKTIHY